MTRSISYAGRQASQPNNTYVVVDTGSYNYNDYIRLKLYCCSNTTSSSVGSFTFPNNVTRTSGYDYFRITRFSSGNSYTGCILMDIYYYYRHRQNCYYYNDWYGVRYTCNQVYDNSLVLSSSETGTYSCNIPDVSGNLQKVYFALNSEGSKYYIDNEIDSVTTMSASLLFRWQCHFYARNRTSCFIIGPYPLMLHNWSPTY